MCYQIITVNHCYANDYEINYKLNKKEFNRKLPESIINKYKQAPEDFSLDTSNLFNEPIKILILYELLQNVISTLDTHKIDYWLTEETLLNYSKFNNFAPWQQDIQLAIDYDNFRKQLNKITTVNKDLVFTYYDNTLTLQNLPNVIFTEAGFVKAVQKHEPELSTEKIIQNYTNLNKNNKHLKLYFYPYNISTVGVTHAINYLYYLFIKSKKNINGHMLTDIFPLRTVYFNSILVKIPNNIAAIIKSENRKCCFYQLHKDRSIYSNDRSLNLKHIKTNLEIMPLLYDFMKFTFEELKICSYTSPEQHEIKK
jgi:hypothetical protein